MSASCRGIFRAVGSRLITTATHRNQEAIIRATMNVGRPAHQDLRIAVVIPARMASSRFPGKPLAPILSLPMIEHVYRRSAMSEGVDEVYIATCDQEIMEATRNFGGKAIMTSDAHTRASDRVAEAAQKLDADIIVMVQGDEPMTTPEMISEAVAPMIQDPNVICVNLAGKIGEKSEYENPNTIKVAINQKGDALYFSREAIPTDEVMEFSKLAVFKQVCIIPFRREALLMYSKLAPTPLEIAESIDMLRFLEYGHPVRLVETQAKTFAVDTQEDLKRVEALLRDDPLTQSYLPS